MRITIVSPLFPPDVASAAGYAKQLCHRLGRDHTVTCLLYGHTPEATAHTTLVSIDKRRPLPYRLMAFTAALWSHLRTADRLIVLNGPSVELPALLCSLLRPIPIVYLQSDAAAAVHPALVYRLCRTLLTRRAHTVCTVPVSLLTPPEIHPLLPHPTDHLASYEANWATHLTTLL